MIGERQWEFKFVVRFIPVQWLFTVGIVIAGLCSLAVLLSGGAPLPEKAATLDSIKWVAAILRWGTFSLGITLALISFPPVWNFVWKITARLGVMPPYINGKYRAHFKTNWSRISLMRDAAFNERKSIDDTILYDQALTELNLEFKINIGFWSSKLEMRPVRPNERVINWSRALVVNITPPCDGLPYRLSYIFKQENHASAVAATDEPSFFGCGMANLHQAVKFDGQFWTNRSWTKGLNTAGQIEFVRQGE